jgi:hypothetical protein
MAAVQSIGPVAADSGEQSSEGSSLFKIYAIAQHPVRVLQLLRGWLCMIADRFKAPTRTRIGCCFVC